MTKKVILFTAGESPTEAELVKLKMLNALAEPLLEVHVMNKAAISEEQAAIMRSCDYHINAPTGYLNGTVWAGGTLTSGQTLTVSTSVTTESDTVTVDASAVVTIT